MKDGTNHVAVDRFTLAHAAAGVAAAHFGLSWQLTLVGAVAFEVCERAWKRDFPQYFPNPSQDTDLNSTFDVAAAMGGHLAYDQATKGRKKRRRRRRKKR